MLAGFSNGGLAVVFAAAAAAVWISGIWLVRSVAVIDRRLGLSQALGGLLILAVVTDLPEIAITVSAAGSGNVDLAVGNILGGIAIQTVVLVLLDFVIRRNRNPLSTLAAGGKLKLEAWLLIVMLGLVVIGSQAAPGPQLHGISAAELLLVAVWLFGIWLVARRRRTGRSMHHRPARLSEIRQLVITPTGMTFAAAAIVTLGAGVLLEQSGEQLANNYHLGGLVFGATALAAAAALPEISSGIAAVRQKDYQLAMSDIFGGNAFLLLLLLPAAAIAGQPLLSRVSGSEIFLVMLGLILTAIYLAGLTLHPPRRRLGLGADSWLVLLTYIVAIAVLARLG